MSDAGADAAKNIELWTQANAEYTDENARTNWALEEISWGIWGIDEPELNVLGDVNGLDVVELGCGTAYFSAWLAKRGAHPVGVDVTPAQLATARRMMAESGIEFPLVEADAGATGLPTRASPGLPQVADRPADVAASKVREEVRDELAELPLQRPYARHLGGQGGPQLRGQVRDPAVSVLGRTRI